MSRQVHIPPHTPADREATAVGYFDWLTIADGRTLNRKLDRIMADLSALNAAVDQLSTDGGEIIAALNDLSTKLGEAGDTTSQAEVDSITEKLTNLGQSLDDAVAADDPAPAVPDQPTA